MKKVVIATALALASITSAFAVTAQSGVYVGALGGWSFADSPDSASVQGAAKNNRNYTWGGNLGYNYAINQNWLAGFEVGYVNFGRTNYGVPANFDIKSSGVQLMATGTYLMTNGFNVFGKAGAIDEETSLTNGQSIDGKSSVTEWLPAVAVGVGYMPMQNLNVALQYEHTFGDDWNDTSITSTSYPKPMTQNAVTLGVSYTFPL